MERIGGLPFLCTDRDLFNQVKKKPHRLRQLKYNNKVFLLEDRSTARYIDAYNDSSLIRMELTCQCASFFLISL